MSRLVLVPLRYALARQPTLLPTFLALLSIVFAALQVGAPARADHGSPLTVEEARRIVSPLYAALNRPAVKEVAELISRATTPDWQSCGSNSGCVSRAAAIAAVERRGTDVPDLEWAVMDIQVAGPNTIVVRSEVSGTPVHDFYGVKPSGRRFRVMSIDIHSVVDGKIARSYHVEDWATAAAQLSAR